MKKLTWVLVITLFCGGLAGCTPNVETIPVVTQTLTPVPRRTADEQAAIDTVQKYIEIWSETSQNLDDEETDLYQIRDVASGDITTQKVLVWNTWIGEGTHLVGTPAFEVKSVAKGILDSEGQRYDVRGCYSMEEAYFVDRDGNEVPKAEDRQLGRYEVLTTDAGSYIIAEEISEDKPC